MSPPWSRPLEIDRLAEAQSDVDFAVPLAELDGLRTLRGGVAGSVAGRVHFARQQGTVVAELAMRGTATLECQRCTQPMQLALDTVARLALIGSEVEAERVPADLEPVLAPGGRTTIGALITEELLLTLPIVPSHPGDAQCASVPASTAGAQGTASGETHKPFARLAELMKR